MNGKASPSSAFPERVEDGVSKPITTSFKENQDAGDSQNSTIRRADHLLRLAGQDLPSSETSEEHGVEEHSPIPPPLATSVKAKQNITTVVDRRTGTIANTHGGCQSRTESTNRLNAPNFERDPRTAELTPVEKPQPSGTKVSPRSESASSSNIEGSSSDHGTVPNIGGGFKVMYSSNSNISNNTRIKTELVRHHVIEVKRVADCDYFCVGAGKKLKKTANLILAVIMGKPIISDVWARKSAEQGLLQDPMGYLARSPEQETKWGINLEEASKRGEQHLMPLKNKKILVSPTVWKDLGTGLKDLKEIAKYAGAASIQARLPTISDSTILTIVISSDSDPHLSQLRNNGWRCFSKDIITTGVLRGKVDMSSDEFLITEPESSLGSRGKKRKQSS